jgi:flagellar biosynthesis protein FliR
MLNLVLNYAGVFTLVLVRMSGFFILTPVFGSRNVPAAVKAGLTFFLAILVTPVVAATQAGALVSDYSMGDMVLIILKETMVGITLGLVAALVFAAVQVGGMFVDLQIGFAMSNVFDPMTGTSSPLTGQFKFALSMLFFLGLDGHHGLLTGLLQSYTFIPIGGFSVTGNLINTILHTFSLMFLLGMKIAIPIVAALFLTDVGLAILSRAVPQMNVFVLGMPVKIIVGGFMLIVVMPAFVYLLRTLFDTMFSQMDTLLRVLGG